METFGVPNIIYEMKAEERFKHLEEKLKLISDKALEEKKV